MAAPGRGRTIGRVDIDTFVRDGYVAVRGAFDERTAKACRDMIWESLGGQGISRTDRTLDAAACQDRLPGGRAVRRGGRLPEADRCL
jgi:hypothetical protein